LLLVLNPSALLFVKPSIFWAQSVSVLLLLSSRRKFWRVMLALHASHFGFVFMRLLKILAFILSSKVVRTIENLRSRVVEGPVSLCENQNRNVIF
jgi:hypothetical protein